MYFDLVRLFSQTYSYSSNAQHVGVPIITEPFTISDSYNIARSTVKEVYTQIENDLLTADTLLETKSITPFTFNKTSVRSLLCLLNLTKEEYNTALEYAEDVIYNYSFALVPADEYYASWSDESSSESIFSVAMTATDNPGTNSIGHMLSPSGYGAIIPTSDLTDLYSSKDVRNQFLQKEDEEYYIK